MRLHHLKKINKIFLLAITTASLSTPLLTTGCTDPIKFGDSFLEKAPGGDTNEDTVFNSSVYTKQFLNRIYRLQYYGLTYGSGNANCNSGWTGKFEALTDCWELYYASALPWKLYYTGSRDASSDGIFGYDNEYVWEAVRACYKLLEHIDNVPGLTDSEIACMKAEAKCLIATRYFDAFQFYGGLPIVTQTYSGTEGTYNLPRATVEETVNFMVNLLDEAIATPQFPWAYDDTTLQTEAGHWTKAGAMALKARILTFAASPLFNAEQGYYGGTSEAEQQHLVWYGNYDQTRWTRAKEACKAFLDSLNANGGYELEQAEGTRPQDYRVAFRHAYFDEGSSEVLHSVRVTYKAGSNYNWYYWVRLGRSAYAVTEEYVEMFPWSDGTPFKWEQDSIDGKLNHLFLKGDTVSGNVMLQNVELTRDPRLYESAVVNGMMPTLDWSTGAMSGVPYELWVGGRNALYNSEQETGTWATSYINMKYSLGDGNNSDYNGHGLQWVTLRLPDVYLMYAEALIQADGNLTEALKWIDKVRARVGLKGLEEIDSNYETDASALLEELLNERARELGFENARYFDLIRYKRADIFEKQLHGMHIYRMVKNPTTGGFERCDVAWYNASRGTTFTCSDGTEVKVSRKDGVAQPSVFTYERYPLTRGSRIWWTEGFDPKWYLSPFPSTEINKNYGLIQNPGWE